MSPVEAPVTAAREISAETWRLAWVIAFGAFVGGLDISIVNIALDTIRPSFHTSLSTRPGPDWADRQHLNGDHRGVLRQRAGAGVGGIGGRGGLV